jgi:hypothetical protein
VGLANLGSESETCVGSRVHLVGVSISFEKNFYRLPFTPPSLVRRIVPSITKENTIDRPSLELVQLLPFLKDKALATKYMEVTHLGCATVHQLIACFLLMHSEVDLVRNIARGIHCLSPEPSRSPMLIKHRPSHLAQGSVFPFHNTILGGVYRLENWCSRPKSWQKVSK